MVISLRIPEPLIVPVLPRRDGRENEQQDEHRQRHPVIPGDSAPALRRGVIQHLGFHGGCNQLVSYNERQLDHVSDVNWLRIERQLKSEHQVKRQDDNVVGGEVENLASSHSFSNWAICELVPIANPCVGGPLFIDRTPKPFTRTEPGVGAGSSKSWIGFPAVSAAVRLCH